MTRQSQNIYEFGPYRFDAAKRLLLRGGEVVPLTPKCFEILLVFVENSGEVIEKEDLMNRVWPDSYVEEGNLTYNISVLRKALGERTNEHLYIVTVPGRGYQFVAPVSEVRPDGVGELIGERLSESANKPERLPGEANSSSLEQFLGASKRYKRSAILALVLIVSLVVMLIARQLSTGPANAERISVAVVDFGNDTNEDDLNGLSGQLITALEQSRRLSVLTRSRMLDILKQLGKGSAERIDESLGREICKRAKVDALVIASIRKFDQLYTIDVKVLDPHTSEYLLTVEERTEVKASIPELIDRLSERTPAKLRESLRRKDNSWRVSAFVRVGPPK